MINNLINYFSNKEILILGFGREGISTYNLIRKYLPEKNITIADEKIKFYESYEFLLNDKNVKFFDGENYMQNLNKFDIIMKSPGIPFNKIDTKPIMNKIKSQMELFLEFFNNYTIGVTGTKGKSTTSSLIYTILKENNKDVYLLGNIGKPIFDVIDEINENTIIVLEMSSHQLEFLKKSPNIAILLNIFEEHLDHYKSYQGYIDAKCNIFRNQKEDDFFLYNIDNKTLTDNIKNTVQKCISISINGNKQANCYLDGEDIIFDGKKIYSKNDKRNLKGDYNLNNIMFALCVCEILNIDINKAKKSIENFKTLPHRLEFVKNVNGVDYYDNSIATIPMATIEAVEALKNVNTLIIGGMDRGIDYTSFVDFLYNSNIENIICMPKTGYDIADKLENKIVKNNINNIHIYKTETLQEAVEISKKVTKKNMICLLSPAAASYGFFKNFEEKGDLFKKLVTE